jgi:hypothetical protein
MEKVKDVFVDYGGHKGAGGFSVMQENIHTLEDRLNEAFLEMVKENKLIEDILVDKKLSLDEVSWDTYRLIEKFAPFGLDNPKPLFLFENIKISNVKLFGKEQNHLELKFRNSKGSDVTAIAFFVVLGGIAQIRSELFSHDKVASAIRGKLLNAINNANADSYLSNTNEGINLAELQTKDTDNDSLTDFEELYVHNTSPYLADSDSDTVTDPDELAAGTNPNCPETQACTYGPSEGTSTTTSAQNAFADLDPTKLGIDTTTGTVDPAVLREKLLEYGISKDVLDKTDDATLLELFNQTLQGGSIAGGTNSAEVVQQQAEQILAMTLDQKRQLLVQSGLDSATVEALDEETINNLLEQAVTQAVMQVTEQGTNSNSNTNENTNTNAASNTNTSSDDN